MAAPLYVRVKEHVLDRIADRTLRPGDRVPSENELVEALGVSRMTANRALRELTAEGLLVRRHGKGTFVAQRRVRSHPLRIQSIRELIEERGQAYGCRVLEVSRDPAQGPIADRMAVEPGTALFRSRIVHTADGVPLQLEERHVDAALVPGYGRVDFTRRTPTEYLLEKVPLQLAEHGVLALLPDRATARLLEIDPAEPCLVVQRRTYSDDRIASVATLTHPGSRYALTGVFTEEIP